MATTKNLQNGIRCGYWTIVSAIDDDWYLCRCVCGKEQAVSKNYLLSGVSTSCGCRYNRTVDLTGKRFGMLIAIEPLPDRTSDMNVQWLCRCDCGNRKVFKAALLTSGRRKSCGCMGVQTSHLIKSRTFVEGTCVEYMFSDNTPKNNTSGRKGVNLDRGKWRASITYGGRTRWLGSFDNFEDAVRVREQAEEEVRNHLLDVMEEKGQRISEEKLLRNLKTTQPKKPDGTSKNNATGYLGVTKYGNRYRASICRNRHTRWLGTFKTIEEAIAARRQAEAQYELDQEALEKQAAETGKAASKNAIGA